MLSFCQRILQSHQQLHLYLANRRNNRPNAVFDYIQDNAKLYGGEIGLHFHPHPLDWLHFETSFETVTGKMEITSFPLTMEQLIRTEFKIKNWLKDGLQR
jgi:hypothetical protein